MKDVIIWLVDASMSSAMSAEIDGHILKLIHAEALDYNI